MLAMEKIDKIIDKYGNNNSWVRKIDTTDSLLLLIK